MKTNSENKFCINCGIIVFLNGEILNDSKKVDDKYFCRECFFKKMEKEYDNV